MDYKKYIPAVASFIGGGGVGAVITYFVMKQRAEKRVQEELASIRKVYRQREETILREMGKVEDPGPELQLKSVAPNNSKKEETNVQPVPVVEKEADEEPQEEGPEDDDESSTRVYSPDGSFEDVDPSEIQRVSFELNERMQQLQEAAKEGGRPYVIPEYSHDFQELPYDEIVLTYYKGDDVLADDQENIIDDRVRLVGEDALTSFGQGCSDDYTVYVRNDKNACIYQIELVESCYGEVVAGFLPEVTSE